MANCVGNPTFALNSFNPNHFDEWPASLTGYVCKTPPIGSGRAPRFAECCAGSKVFNVTSAVGPEDPEYPVSCALFCLVDPARNALEGSDFLRCLGGGRMEGMQPEWEVVCRMNGEGGGTTSTSAATGTRTPSAISSGGGVTSTQLGGTTITPSTPGVTATRTPSSSVTPSDKGPATTTASSGEGRVRGAAKSYIVALLLGAAALL